MLQDVHWALGLVGYFPTYVIGSIVSAQIWANLLTAIPDLTEQIERGEFGSLREWLRDHLYRHGRKFTPRETLQKVTPDRWTSGRTSPISATNRRLRDSRVSCVPARNGGGKVSVTRVCRPSDRLVKLPGRAPHEPFPGAYLRLLRRGTCPWAADSATTECMKLSFVTTPWFSANG